MKKADSDKLRFVTDFIELNKCIERQVHQFPSGGDIIKSFDASSVCFAKLDATHGYYQIEMEEESWFLTTFLMTPWGKVSLYACSHGCYRQF